MKFSSSTLLAVALSSVASSVNADCDPGVIVTEIMYNPSSSQGGDGNFEWVEIVNYSCDSVDMTNWKITDLEDRDRLLLRSGDSMVLAPGEYAIIVDGNQNWVGTNNDPFGIKAGTKVFQTDDNRIGNGLGNNADQVILINADNVRVDRVNYNDNRGGCGRAADGSGKSLERIDPLGTGGCSNFRPSTTVGGTPGDTNTRLPGSAIAPGELPTSSCCVQDSGTGGDPHIKMWSGNWMDYHGECDIVLLHAPDFETGLALDLQMRTTARYDYSFISSAALRIGQDILEVGSYGMYMFNGISNLALESMFLAGYPVHHTQPSSKLQVFDVVLGKSENITFSVFKDLVSVKINGGTRHHFANSVGVMGSFNGELLARDGKTIIENNPNAFGQEWQVLEEEPMLFVANREPQLPHQKCRLPSAMEEKGRRLGETIARSAAQEACAHLVTDEQKTLCVFDVMAVGDIDIAQAGAY